MAKRVRLLIIHMKNQKEVYLVVLAPSVTVHYGSRRDKPMLAGVDKYPVWVDYGYPGRSRCQ